MTVKELINELNKQNPNSRVSVALLEDGCCVDIFDVIGITKAEVSPLIWIDIKQAVSIFDMD